MKKLSERFQGGIVDQETQRVSRVLSAIFPLRSNPPAGALNSCKQSSPRIPIPSSHPPQASRVCLPTPDSLLSPACSRSSCLLASTCSAPPVPLSTRLPLGRRLRPRHRVRASQLLWQSGPRGRWSRFVRRSSKTFSRELLSDNLASAPSPPLRRSTEQQSHDGAEHQHRVSFWRHLMTVLMTDWALTEAKTPEDDRKPNMILLAVMCAGLSTVILTVVSGDFVEDAPQELSTKARACEVR